MKTVSKREFYRTPALRGTRFEVALSLPMLEEGAFDVQQTAAVQAIKFELHFRKSRYFLR